MSTYLPRSLVALVALRAGKRCEYCHAPQAIVGQTFHCDHYVPRVVGGESVAENLCFACPHCNQAKGDRIEGVDPRTGRNVRLFNPRADDWDAHFRWSRDWQRLLGRTAVGRATISALNMNAPLLQEARALWHFAGRFP